jgi:glycosyltransferase involved in cell wall biosynthesis
VTPGVPLNIAFITVEFDGPTRNGGIGTACRELATALRECGHRVTVLFAGPFHNHDAAFWRRALALEGIEFTPLHEPGIDDYYRQWRDIGVDAHRWLRQGAYDVVHFHEWLGYGLDTVQAKRRGHGFEDTLLCTTLHGPTHWVDVGNEVATSDPDRQALSRAEQGSVEASDVVFSPSHFLVEHLLARGWKVPAARFVRQNILGRECVAGVTGAEPRRITELVFFGRLEKLKGLDIFCDALDRWDAGKGDVRLTFLGRRNTIAGEDAASYIERRAERWHLPWRIISDMTRERALGFLDVPGRCAVMPSRLENSPYSVLECIGRGIPFLASRVGGTPELICDGQHATVLFDNTPQALCAALSKACSEGVTPVSSAVGFDTTRRAWQTWHTRENIGRALGAARSRRDEA